MKINNQEEFNNAEREILSVQNEIESLVNADKEVSQELYDRYSALDIAIQNY